MTQLPTLQQASSPRAGRSSPSDSLQRNNNRKKKVEKIWGAESHGHANPAGRGGGGGSRLPGFESAV